MVSAWSRLPRATRTGGNLRAAADREDSNVKHVPMENRLPMRELTPNPPRNGQAAALREFETSLKNNPNRFRSINGVALAAEATGDRRKAADHYNKLMTLTRNADTQRPELARARAYVAQR
jgi:hypothetical protein